MCNSNYVVNQVGRVENNLANNQANNKDPAEY
jgi:hypothetical protein